MTIKPTACASDPVLFDSIDVIDHREAARHCAACPALDWCQGQLSEALDKTGHDAWERRVAPRGTWAGQLLVNGRLKARRPADAPV
ncbi:hypothetical protein [Nocardioides sp. LHG3406-4]|uniref:hypothetical protein n=1 Tax=Nocardioides sp. LHG3406-4 TaxID=2804575 RepID=UPI003CEF068A